MHTWSRPRTRPAVARSWGGPVARAFAPTTRRSPPSTDATPSPGTTHHRLADLATSAPIQRTQEEEDALLPNVQIHQREYRSAPRQIDGEQRRYRMDTSPRDDEALRRHIARAQALAGGGRNAAERSALLFHYASNRVPVHDENRNAQYRRGPLEDGARTYHAPLGRCLDNGSACREQAGFLQLLLANENVQTTMRVGTAGNLGGGGRHAWLEHGNRGDGEASSNIFDPRDQSVREHGDHYHPEHNIHLADPQNPQHGNQAFFDQVQGLAHGLNAEHRHRQRWAPGRFFSWLTGNRPNRGRQDIQDLYSRGQSSLRSHDWGQRWNRARNFFSGLFRRNRPAQQNQHDQDIELRNLVAPQGDHQQQDEDWDPFGENV